MGDIYATSKGDFSKTLNWLKSIRKSKYSILNKYGQAGVEALRKATPKDTSLAAISWRYSVEEANGDYRLVFYNDDIEGGYNVALLIQYGHNTKGDTFVEGIDYINPALKPVFDQLSEELWREFTE